MHNNFFFLRKLTAALFERIEGYTLDACYSQDKDELLLEFVRENQIFRIKADLKHQFSCLSFPEEFKRARRNSVNLFHELIGKKVIGMHQFNHERAFMLIFNEEYTLLFKLFGNLSNMLLYRDDQCINVFKHGTGDESKIKPAELDRFPEPFNDRETLTREALLKRYPSLDKKVSQYLETKDLDSLQDETKRQQIIANIMHMLDEPNYYIHEEGDRIRFSLFPDTTKSTEFTDPIAAINCFYSTYQRHFWLDREKRSLLKLLRDQFKKSNNYIRSAQDKLDRLHEQGDYKQYGDIIMANLHNIRMGDKTAEVFDFYNNRMVKINLKENISPQKNAEHYYRKSKNQNIEIQTLRNNIASRKEKVKQLQEFIDTVENIQDIKQLRLFSSKNKLKTSQGQPAGEKPMFKTYEHMGFQILVGRNAKNNDLLTFRYGYKEDLWLHAKDVKGSHVLIKHQAGKNFPKPVITVAAQLAAFNSSQRNSDTCPVIFTPRKFVRKSKGMPAGAVVLDKEEIIFVKPAIIPH